MFVLSASEVREEIHGTVLLFNERAFGIGGISEMFRGSSNEVASMAQPRNRSFVPVHGWFQGNDIGWSLIACVWGLRAGSFASAVVVDERPTLRLRDNSVAGPLGQ
eukprot:11214362-Lingulodinium_polyedra.AAC.1